MTTTNDNARLQPGVESSTNKTTCAKSIKKIDRVIEAMEQPHGLNRFEAERIGEQQHEPRSDALASRLDDVARDLVHQCDIGGQAAPDHVVDMRHVGRHQSIDRGERGSRLLWRRRRHARTRCNDGGL